VKLPVPAKRCVATLENGAQCYKTRVDSSVYCGTHRTFAPFGNAVSDGTPASVCGAIAVQNHMGISLVVDGHRGVVYQARDVLAHHPAPRTIGSYCFVEHAAQTEEVFPWQMPPTSDSDDDDDRDATTARHG
jgi:hypothetical protein